MGSSVDLAIDYYAAQGLAITTDGLKPLVEPKFRVSVCLEHIYISETCSDAFHHALHEVGLLCGDIERTHKILSQILGEFGITVNLNADCENDPFHNHKRIFNPRLA